VHDLIGAPVGDNPTDDRPRVGFDRLGELEPRRDETQIIRSRQGDRDPAVGCGQKPCRTAAALIATAGEVQQRRTLG